MPGAKNFTVEDKRVAIGLWKDQLTDCNATSLPALQLEITRLWVTRMENSDYLRSLVESMPRRLQEVISKAGNTTKY